MLKHYLMIALRNLLKNKTHSFISIFGLALGLSASIMIMLINHSELTRDSFWKDAENIYVVEQRGRNENPDLPIKHLNAEIKHQLKDFFPEILYSARHFSGITLVTIESQTGEPRTFNEPVSQVDPELLDIFSFDVLHGDIKRLANTPNSVILSSNFASKFFGDDNPLGKIITIDMSALSSITGNYSSDIQRKDYSVVAVVEETAYRTELNYGIMIPYFDPVPIENENIESGTTRSVAYNARTFTKLAGVDQLRHIEARLPEFIDKAYDKIFYNNRNPSESSRMELINITDASQADEGNQGPKARILMLYLLAFIILAMASINTINLTLAAYAQRQREVALRKTLGAKRHEIFIQFWIESLISVAAAFLLALILLEFLVPWLSTTLQLDNTRGFLYTTHFFSHLLLLVFSLSLIIGCYPGIYLSRIKPALVLHTSRAHETLGSIRLRKFLVVTQFGLSAALVIAAGLVSVQLYKVMQYDPGYQTKNILYAYHNAFRYADDGQFNSLKWRLLNVRGIQAVAAVFTGIPGQNSARAQTSRADQSPAQAFNMQWSLIAESDQFSLLEIPLVAGRHVDITAKHPGPDEHTFGDGSADMPAHVGEIIINLQAIEFFGFDSPEAAINQTIKRYYENQEDAASYHKIVGVTNWLHYESHDKAAAPTAFWAPWQEPMRMALGVRFSEGTREETEKKISEIWQDTFGNSPHTWLLEDDIARQYANQYTTAKFIYIFSALAIVISTMGLYGLAALSAQKRTREIALRKLHGASAFTIIKLLGADFSKLVLIANIIAWPVALYAMNYWLQSFRLKIDLMIWGSVLAVAALILALAVAWLTLTLQAWKVAQTKPADALREE